MNPEIVEKEVQALRREGLDALIALSAENVAYTLGFPIPSHAPPRSRPAVSIVTAYDQKALVVPEAEGEAVRGRPLTPALYVYGEFTEDPMEKLALAMEDLGIHRAKVAIEMDHLAAADFLSLKGRVPKARWSPAREIFRDLRKVKTAWELDLLARLSRIVERAIRESLTRLHAGAREVDLVGLLCRGVLEQGAEGFEGVLVASGEKDPLPRTAPKDRALREGDLVRCEIVGVLGGYRAGVGRTAVVGEPTEEQMRVWAELQGRRRLTLDLIRPGMRTQALYEKIEERDPRAGEPPKGVRFAIHGIGLSLYEAPFLAKGLDEPLQTGMVLGVEHALQRPGLGMKVKDVVAITEEGRKLLSDSSSSDELFRIGKEIGPLGTSP